MYRFPLAVFLLLATGCDDTSPSTDPGTEGCDAESTIQFEDADGDGHGDPATASCTDAVAEGAVENGDDCDDSDGATFPGAEELCDGLDNDCDGVADTGLLSTFYADADGDGYGSDASAEACTAPDGFAAASGDCDDSDAFVYPGAAEVCDGVPNDCDGSDWSAGDEDGMATFFSADGAADLSDMAGEQRIDDAGTLRLCDGRWQVNIEITAPGVSVIGNGEGDTILNGSANGSVLHARGADGLWLEGLTVTNGTGAPCAKGDPYTCGGGIHLQDSNADLVEVSVTNSTADAGGGILARGSDLQLDDITITGNSSTFNGGGMFFTHSEGTMVLSDSTIEGNVSGVGGGLVALDAMAVSIEGTTIRDNLALFYGGGMSIDISGSSGTTGTITDSVFSGNRVDNEYCNETNCLGGALYVGDADVSMSGTAVTDSFALVLGGGVYVTEAGSFSGEALDFADNTPEDIYDAELGAALSPDADGDITVK